MVDPYRNNVLFYLNVFQYCALFASQYFKNNLNKEVHC